MSWCLYRGTIENDEKVVITKTWPIKHTGAKVRELPKSVDLIDQLRRRSDLIDDSTELLPLGRVASIDGARPADATAKFLVRSESGNCGFLTVSGEGNPDLVARATRNIKNVRRKLSDRYAEPIVEPLETGVALGFSFAVWPMLATFPQGKLARFLAKRRLGPDILDWLHGLCAETVTCTKADEREKIAANLMLLHDDQRHPGYVRRTAAAAAERLASGQWAPVQCVQHSDLWLGNVMIAPRGSAWSFAVIDWAGATVSGYPFFDLCRFGISSNPPWRLIQENLQRHLDHFDFDRADVVPYVLCALGQMQSDLEFFPEDLFREMVVETTGFATELAGTGS